jgi:sarcosine oxidase subunit beta
MTRKIVLCRCEDVTLKDVERAIATGFAALEEVKRYTGFGTGPCQGKECLVGIAAAIARITGQAPATIPPFTSRAPLFPTELCQLAGPLANGDEPAADVSPEPPPER